MKQIKIAQDESYSVGAAAVLAAGVWTTNVNTFSREEDQSVTVRRVAANDPQKNRGFFYELSHRIRFEVDYAKQQDRIASKTVLISVPNLK